MDDVVRCPGCEANLTLPPVAAGNTVQCGRCQRVFDPVAPRGITVAAPLPTHVLQVHLGSDPTPTAIPSDDLDDDLRVDSRRWNSEPLGGNWAAYLAITMIGLGVLAFAVEIWAQAEFFLLAAQQRKIGPRPFEHRFGLPHRVDEEFFGGERPRIEPRVLEMEQRWIQWDGFAQGVEGFGELACVLAFALYLVWLWRAYGNLSGLRAGGLSYSSGWAIVCCFIPLVNLFAPFPVLQELWRSSHPDAIETRYAWRDTAYATSIRWWWLFFFAAVVLGFSAYFVTPSFAPDPDAFLPAAFLWGVASVFAVAAGVTIIYIIHTITRRQIERFERLQNM